MTFKALLATKTGEAISTRVVEMNEQDLMPGDVTIAVDYSTVNYKDAMAITGRVDVIRQFPLIPGIDLAGTVVASSYPGIAVGDRVVANSWGLSQTHHGGYAQKARVKGEWLVKIPAPFSTKDAMAIGTAGYTAMLSVLALEHGGLTPQRGDILVTGANGGVGSIAIAILSDLGYRVDRVDRTSRGRRLSAQPRRGGDHRPPDAFGAGSADRERKMGWRGGLRWQSYAGERAGADTVSRRGRRPAAWLRAWIFLGRSCPSSCATSPSPVSTR